VKRTARASFAAALGLALTACSYQPSMQHPTLPALAPIESTMDCRQTDVAIDRADTVRWLIRDDGAKLETDVHRSARYTANALLITASILALNPNPPYFKDGGHAVLNAADERIRELLQLKREHACPARPTALPELDDLALLGELEALQSDFGANRIDEEQMLTRRTKLLDNLRLVQSPDGRSPSDAPPNDRDQ
jgi:hypothetical protein